MLWASLLLTLLLLKEDQPRPPALPPLSAPKEDFCPLPMFLIMPSLPLPFLSQHRQREEQPLTSPTPLGVHLTFRPILSRGQILLRPYLSPGYGTQVVSPPRCSGGYVFMTHVPFAGTSRNLPIPFLDRPSPLTGLLDSVMLTHQG